jgi:hypothetical protein
MSQLPTEVLAALTRTEPVGSPVRRPVGRLEPERTEDAQHYADRPPPGFYLLDDAEPAEVGDMAYIGGIGGEWVRVRQGMNIAGATLDELLGWGSVISLARLKRAKDRAPR